MDRSRSLRYLLLLVLLLCACFQRFIEIQTIATSRGIAFEVPEIDAGLKQGQVYELLDILTGLASFEGRVLRPTIVSYS